METRNGRKVPVEDWPNNVVVGNKDIVFDWLLSPDQSIRQGRFVTHRTVQDLGTLYDDGLYMNLDKINIEQSSENNDSNQDHSEATSKDSQDTTPNSDIYTDVEIYERVGKFNVYKENGEWRALLDRGDTKIKKYLQNT